MTDRPHVFVALYVGSTIAQARILGATSDPALVAAAAERLKCQLDMELRSAREFNPDAEVRLSQLRAITLLPPLTD